MKHSCNKGFFIVAGLMGLSMQTLKKQELTQLSLRNNVYNAKLSVKTRLEHGFCHRLHVFPMIISVCTLLSLLQSIKRPTMHVVKHRKLTLFS